MVVGERRTVCWVCPTVPDFAEIHDRLRPDLVVADVIDDQRLWPLDADERDAVDRNYADVLGLADVVLANCESVREAMLPYSDEIHLVPNAAEAVERADTWTRPRELRRLAGPIIGYVGNLEAVRLDVDLVASVVAERPGWQFVFIGSAARDNPLRALRDRPNVHLLGIRRYDEARRFIRHFDVAIIPHLDNALTRHMNPLKLYVYFSLGVPIVATPIANAGAAGEFIQVGKTADEFVDRIEACLASGPPTDSSRISELLDGELMGGTCRAGDPADRRGPAGERQSVAPTQCSRNARMRSALTPRSTKPTRDTDLRSTTEPPLLASHADDDVVLEAEPEGRVHSFNDSQPGIFVDDLPTEGTGDVRRAGQVALDLSGRIDGGNVRISRGLHRRLLGGVDQGVGTRWSTFDEHLERRRIERVRGDVVGRHDRDRLVVLHRHPAEDQHPRRRRPPVPAPCPLGVSG